MGRHRRARRHGQWLRAGFVGGGLAFGAWFTSAASAAADDRGATPTSHIGEPLAPDGGGSFASIPTFGDSGLVSAPTEAAAEAAQSDQGGPTGSAADAASPAGQASDQAAAIADQDADAPTLADFNDPMYPDQFTLGDMENQWYDTYMHDLPYPKVHIDWDVPITMSDGTVLKANVYRPVRWDGTIVDDKLPALVNITPYTKLVSMLEDSGVAWDDLEWLADSLGNFQSPVSGLKGIEAQLQMLNGGVLQEFGVQRRLVQSGYVQIVVDARGTGFSQGTWQAFGHREQLDGKEVVEWAANQPWSTGKVGMNGLSYSGINQLEAAALRPKGLSAIYPIVPTSDLVGDIVAPGGGFAIGFMPILLAGVSTLSLFPDLSAYAGDQFDWQWADDRYNYLYNSVWPTEWSLVAPAISAPSVDVLVQNFMDSLSDDSPVRQELDRRMANANLSDVLANTDLVHELLDMARQGSPWREQILQDGDLSKFPVNAFDFIDQDSSWRKDLRTDVGAIDVPTMVVGGWHDLFANSEPRIFNELNLPAGEKKLIMGDWYHSTAGSGNGKYPNPPRLDVLARAWFDHWLKGVDNGIDKYAPVTLFSQGDGWTNSDVWPRRGMDYQKLYLSGQQAMSTAFSMLDGSLSDQPDEDENGHWISFGLTSICSRDGTQGLAGIPGVMDACGVDSRISELDGFTFTSEPVDEQTVVSGPMAVHLNTVQQNKDGYWNVTVNDVDEFGQSKVLSSGQLSVSLRGLDESKSKRLPDGTVVDAYPILDARNWHRAEPGDSTPIDVGVTPIDATLQPGHRLRVDVFAGNFPKAMPIWPLMNDMMLAPQMLDLDPNSPSWVVLPVNHRIPGVS